MIKNQKGQVLLLTVMLLAAALTIVMAASFKSTTETQTTKLEEESQKALAAAEAGVEAALQKNTTVDIGGLSLGSGFSGTASTIAASSPSFVTPLLQKDEQYTFYLSTYNPGPPSSLTGSYGSGDLTVDFGQNGNCASLEFTLVKKDGSVRRRLAVPSGCTGINGSDLSPTTGTYTLTYNSVTTTFSYQTKLTAAGDNLSNYDLLFVRIISPTSGLTTPVGFQAGSNLPVQGSTVSSQANSPGGVTKKVQLFQSYPQIPADFFVTSF